MIPPPSPHHLPERLRDRVPSYPTPCGEGWLSNDGSDHDLACGRRPGRHLIHIDAKTGDRFIGIGCGLIAWSRKNRRVDARERPVILPLYRHLPARSAATYRPPLPGIAPGLQDRSPVEGSTTIHTKETTMPPAKRGTPAGKTRVRAHARTTATGRSVRVRSHNRTVTAWQQAGIAWAGTAATGATTLALVVELGLTLISAVLMLVTALIGALAVAATAKASKPRRRMRAKTRTRRPAARRRRR